MRAALAMLVMALPALAADPFAGLKRLDRVVVTGRSGDTVKGVVRSILRGRLSIQLEGREGVTGSMAFERSAVKSVERTGVATEEELKALTEPPEPPPEGFVEPEKEPEPAKPAPPPQRPVLEAFPPAEWTATRRDEIVKKDAYLRSADETEFLARFDEWSAAVEDRAKAERAHLLKRFPEGNEWNAAAYQRLRFTLAVLGRELTAPEREFVERYDDWRKALQEK